MSHYKFAQSFLLVGVVGLIVAAILVVLFHGATIERNDTATGNQVNLQQTVRDNTASANSGTVPIPTKQLHLRDPSVPVSRSDFPSGPSGESIASSGQHKPSEKQRAVETFHKAMQCNTASNEIENLQGQIAVCYSLGSAMDDICRRNIKQAEADIQTQTARLAGCSPVPAVLEKAYFDAVGKAAKLGDTKAQVCYIEGNFSIEISQAQIEQYKDNGRNYIQLGLKRGDWRVVKLLAADHSMHISGFLGLLSSNDNLQIYRMNRLLWLGANGDYATRLDSDLRDFAHPLTTDQIEIANEWALAEYERYFRSSPMLSTAPITCELAG